MARRAVPAVAAEGAPTQAARRGTIAAQSTAAVIARRAAVAAEVPLTGFAAAEFVSTQGEAAAGAVPALPFVEADVGTAAVIGRQHPLHDLEVVQDPSREDGAAKRLVGVARAETLVLDVGVGHVWPIDGRMRFLRHHPQRAVFVEPSPVPDQPERAELNFFKRDRLRGDGEFLLGQIDLNVIEPG